MHCALVAENVISFESKLRVKIENLWPSNRLFFLFLARLSVTTIFFQMFT
jgi:hypothetical protein